MIVHARELPQHTTGADLAFALSAFQRIKDQLKAERRVNREKDKRIKKLEQELNIALKPPSNKTDRNEFIYNYQTQINMLTKSTCTQLEEITQLRALLNEQSTTSILTIDANRHETEKLRDQLAMTQEDLSKVHLDLTNKEEQLKTSILELKRTRRIAQSHQKHVQELEQSCKTLKHENDDTRDHHRLLILESQKDINKHRLLEFKWGMEHEQLSSALAQCQYEAHQAVEQTREEARRQTLESLAVLSRLLAEERQRSKEVAIELKEERTTLEKVTEELVQEKKRTYESTLQPQLQASIQQQKREMIVVTPTTSTSTSTSTKMNPFFEAAADAADENEETRNSTGSNNKSLRISIAKQTTNSGVVNEDYDNNDNEEDVIISDVYQRALDSVAHLVIDHTDSVRTSHVHLQTLKRSMMDLKLY